MPSRPRRVGEPETKRTIIDAAAAEFRACGYNDGTIRAIARRAQVDPALVYHYFKDKPRLYAATLDIPADPRQIRDRVHGSAGSPGLTLVERFLAQWETTGAPPGRAFVTLAQALTSSPEAARGLQEFLAERIWGDSADEGEDVRWHRAQISAVLIGVAWQRYILRAEPLASAPVAEIAARIAPAIEAMMPIAQPGPGPVPPESPRPGSGPVTSGPR